MKHKNQAYQKSGSDKTHAKKSLYEKIPPIKHPKSIDADKSKHINQKQLSVQNTDALSSKQKQGSRDSSEDSSKNSSEDSSRGPSTESSRGSKGFMSRIVAFVKERPILKSFSSIDSNFLYVILFDVIYYAIMVLSIMIFMNWFFSPNLPILQDAKLLTSQLSSGGSDTVMSQLSSISTAYYTLVWATIALFGILLLNYVIFKSLIWKRLLHKKYSFAYAWKFVIVTLFLLILLSSIGGLSLVAFTDVVLTYFIVFFLLPFAVHLFYVSYPMLTIDDSLKSFFVRFWNQALGKLYSFFLPIFFIITLFGVLLLPDLPIRFPYLLMVIALFPIVILAITYLIFYLFKSGYKTNISNLIIDFVIFFVLAIVLRVLNIVLAIIQDFNLTMFRFALIVSLVLFLNWSKLYIIIIIRRLNPELDKKEEN
jgi:hypothetical protein